MATPGPEASTDPICAVAGSESNSISGGSGAEPGRGCGSETGAERPAVIPGDGSAERINAART
jgi:hypothetical protein